MNASSRILVVDDSDIDRMLIAAALEQLSPGAEIVSLQDGAEALEYLRCRGDHSRRPPGNPDLVLLDLNMPRLGGLDVLQAVKSDPRLQLIPVVILSSSDLDADVSRAYRSGANGYVVKPATNTQLFESIRRLHEFWISCNLHPPSSIPQVRGELIGFPTSA